MKPKLHFTAPYHWINDPNGFSWYQGQIHLFYQYHPYTTEWGPMHWGHSVSDDMIHWKNMPSVLAPDQEYDKRGCFSGSAVEEDGKLYLYYTGVNYTVENPEDINLCLDEQFVSAQMMITSEDGMQWKRMENMYSSIPESAMCRWRMEVFKNDRISVLRMETEKSM